MISRLGRSRVGPFFSGGKCSKRFKNCPFFAVNPSQLSPIQFKRKMDFVSMVEFMIKWAFASIPAIIIITLIITFIVWGIYAMILIPMGAFRG